MIVFKISVVNVPFNSLTNSKSDEVGWEVYNSQYLRLWHAPISECPMNHHYCGNMIKLINPKLFQCHNN